MFKELDKIAFVCKNNYLGITRLSKKDDDGVCIIIYFDNASLGQFITQRPQLVHTISSMNGKLFLFVIASRAHTNIHVASSEHVVIPSHLSM